MPLTVYCPNDECCKANIYSLNKPKFCGFCGSSLESMGATKPQYVPKKSSRRQEPIEDDDEDDDDRDIGETVDMDFKLDFKIDYAEDRSGVKLGDLANAKKTGFNRESKKLTKKAQKQAVENICNEAKNTGKPIEVSDEGPE